MSTPYQSGSPIDRGDSLSVHSDSPLQPPAERVAASQYPPTLPSLANANNKPGRPRHVQLPPDPHQYDAERAMMYPDGPGSMPLPPSAIPDPPSALPESSTSGHAYHRSGNRNGSWDLLAGLRKFEHSYEEFDTRNASQTHLAFADGDMPKNSVRIPYATIYCRMELTG